MTVQHCAACDAVDNGALGNGLPVRPYGGGHAASCGATNRGVGADTRRSLRARENGTVGRPAWRVPVRLGRRAARWHCAISPLDAIWLPSVGPSS